MATQRDHQKLNAAITFVDAQGDAVTFTAVDQVIVRRDDAVVDCYLIAQGKVADLDTWLGRNLFGLAQLTVPMGRPDTHFGADSFFTMELQLDPTLIPNLMALGDDDAARAAAFLALPAGSDEPLRASENWRACALYQRRGGMRHGYRSAGGEATGQERNTDETASAAQADLLEALSALEALTNFAIGESQRLQTGEADGPDDEFDGDEPDDHEPDTTAAVVFAVLTDDEWPFEVQGDSPLLTATYQSDHGRWTCVGHMRDDPAVFIFYSVAALAVPQARRLAVAEYLTRANQGLIFGNFELDFDDGEVRFKTSAAFDEGPFVADAVRPVIYGNVDTMERYLPGLMAVSFGNVAPAQAIAEIEDHSSA